MAEKNPPADPPPGTSSPEDDDPDLNELLRANIISDALDPEGAQEGEKARRRRLGLPVERGDQVSMMVELNLLYPNGIARARSELERLLKAVTPPVEDRPQEVGEHYMRCRMTIAQARHLSELDSAEAFRRARESEAGRAEGNVEAAGLPPGPMPPPTPAPAGSTPKPHPNRYQVLYRIWPDFLVRRQVDVSAATVKADAARRSFDATGDGVAWAVVDSGVDANHPHFRTHDTLGGNVSDLHYDFTQPDIPEGLDAAAREAEVMKRRAGALTDQMGHGTHVAGIIAGALVRLPEGSNAGAMPRAEDVVIVRGVQQASKDGIAAGLERRTVSDLSRLSGIAPRARIVSLKVLTGGTDTSSNVMRALYYVRDQINGNGKIMRVHGVNLSLGYEFDPQWFACGQSPLCVEVDRLVRSGVVVVVAAGNTGYGRLASVSGQTGAGLTLTINDPGNAQLAITVGATHRESPHTYGVSFFSSKGPTGDGRLKPDIVAPGERITSCAGGANRDKVLSMLGGPPPPAFAPYIEDSGTSMATPHVSGAIASFLSIRREFIGKPEEVKRIFLDTATSLGREHYFEGRGLVDLMRAIQSV